MGLAIEPPVVVLYTRDGCHLCDSARDELLGMRGDLPPFELREVDIESDEALHAAYLERIPVIEVEGEPISELWLDRAALERVLRASRRIP